MAETTNSGSGTGNTSIVAVLVMFLVVALGVGIFAFRGKLFGGPTKTPEKVEIEVTTPAEPAPPTN